MSEINISEIQDSVESFTQTVAALKQIQTINAELNGSAQQVKESARTIAEEARDIRRYAVSTAKAIDELRIQESNNAREIREKIDQANGKWVDEISEIRKGIKKAQAIATVGCIAALIAVAVAIYGFFFH